MYRFDRTRALTALTALLLLCLAALPASAGAVSATAGDAPEKEGILRLHVIANSDGSADQRVKLLVRDAILEAMPAGESAAETRAHLLSQGAALLETAERVLRENGFSYGAQLMLGRFSFPDRSYGDAFFPAGEYEALRVVLGSGGGQNWWCVLFPPLCIVSENGEPAPAREDLRFESSLLKWLRAWRDGK